MSLPEGLFSGGFFYEGDLTFGAKNPSFGADSKFNSDSVLEICMGDANYQLECKIKDLTLLYNTFQPMLDLLHRMYRKIITKSKDKIILLAIQIGNYKLLEGAGTTIESSINTMGAATLGIELVKHNNFIFN